MKRFLPPLVFLCLIPFAGISQFKEKNPSNSNGNSNNNKNSSKKADTSSTNNNNNTPKPSAPKATENNNYNTPGQNSPGAKVGQAYTAEFSDGSKEDYIVVSSSAADENKVTVDIAPFGMFRGWDICPLAVSYYCPEKFFLKGYFYLSVGNNGNNALGGSADILYFLTTKSKPKRTEIYLSQSGNVIMAVRHEIPKEVSFGIHAGVGYDGIEKKLPDGETTSDSNHAMGPVVALGVGLFKARHIEFFVPSYDSKNVFKRTINTGIYFDVLYIPNGIHPIAARAYIDGKISVKHSKHEWGFYYQAGAIVNYTEPVILGLGPFFTF